VQVRTTPSRPVRIISNLARDWNRQRLAAAIEQTRDNDVVLPLRLALAGGDGVGVRRSRCASLRIAFCAALFALYPGHGAAAGPAAEQGRDQTGTASAAEPRPNPDFLFGRPKGSFGIRSGLLFARAGSNLFDFLHRQLTIDGSDFNTPAFAVDIGGAVARHVDVLFGFEYSRATLNSEYRNLVDSNRLPIAQRTRLQQINLSASAKIPLVPRGHEVGQLAWIAYPVSPYVGAGAGFLRYEFDQSGDFVDVVDLSIFRDALQSSGWAPSTHVFGGVDIKLWRRVFLTAEGRYLWAKATLGQDFTGFDPIDLTGLKVTAGVNLLF
jgi:hypothetical protein